MRALLVCWLAVAVLPAFAQLGDGPDAAAKGAPDAQFIRHPREADWVGRTLPSRPDTDRLRERLATETLPGGRCDLMRYWVPTGGMSATDERPPQAALVVRYAGEVAVKWATLLSTINPGSGDWRKEPAYIESGVTSNGRGVVVAQIPGEAFVIDDTSGRVLWRLGREGGQRRPIDVDADGALHIGSVYLDAPAAPGRPRAPRSLTGSVVTAYLKNCGPLDLKPREWAKDRAGAFGTYGASGLFAAIQSRLPAAVLSGLRTASREDLSAQAENPNADPVAESDAALARVGALIAAAVNAATSGPLLAETPTLPAGVKHRAATIYWVKRAFETDKPSADLVALANRLIVDDYIGMYLDQTAAEGTHPGIAVSAVGSEWNGPTVALRLKPDASAKIASWTWSVDGVEVKGPEPTVPLSSGAHKIGLTWKGDGFLCKATASFAVDIKDGAHTAELSARVEGDNSRPGPITNKIGRRPAGGSGSFANKPRKVSAEFSATVDGVAAPVDITDVERIY